MRTVAKRKRDFINIELERLKELCRQQADFESELQQALQEFAENYCDETDGNLQIILNSSTKV